MARHKRNRGYKLKKAIESIDSNRLRLTKSILNAKIIIHLINDEMDEYFSAIAIVNGINVELEKRAREQDGKQGWKADEISTKEKRP